MPTYISLLNFTDQGIRTVHHTLERARAAGELAEKMGGTLKDGYWAVGPYDVVIVTEFPDDQTSAAFWLAIGEQGNIRSTTLRAFDENEMKSVIDKID